ncbi:ABC transporter substrate-binding protein [Corynebacterium suranareeae]|uniref:ABC transporter substrate-binding protein n=1 Tax=Corynebacterium suranareeae TaxID=2506452 RepID=A0A160PM75_9CORY|nr:ABC transporter substrate-binding protein [Corynebacterium suranareeae]BAU94829.1 ABC transporter substrate-binding protein [Corynebacterium suranareeae]
MSLKQTLKRTATTVLALGASAALLVACSEPSADTSADATGNASADSTGDATGDAITITAYTSEPEEKVDEINRAFMMANPDIKVEVYRAGTGDLTARIEAEKASGSVEADVLWAADAATFESYAAQGDLAELSDVDTSSVIDEALDAENFYVGTRIIPTVIAYNTEAIDQAELPTSWADLTDPKYAGQLVMPDPAVSGAAAFNASVWKNDPALGEDWITALGENQPMIAQSNGPASQEIAGGGHPVGIVVDYLVRDLAAAGSPIDTIYASEGSPYITEPAGVFADSDKKEAAQRYINFLLSAEGQEIAIEQAYLPVREDVGTPEGTPELADIELMTPDLEVVTADKAAAVEFFQNAMN